MDGWDKAFSYAPGAVPQCGMPLFPPLTVCDANGGRAGVQGVILSLRSVTFVIFAGAGSGCYLPAYG